MTTVAITPLDEDEPAQLFHHFQFEIRPQPVYLELDTEDGEFTVDWDGDFGNGIPASVYNGCTLRWTLARIPTAAAANALLAELAPLAQRILDGYEVEWDGSNRVGHPTADDAAEAIKEITYYCQEEISEATMDLVSECDAADWFSEGLGDIVITPDTTDEQIAAYARAQEQAAATMGSGIYYVLTGVEEYLANLRAELREQA